jgi:hypothetical protein
MTISSRRIPELVGRSREEFIEEIGKVFNDLSFEEYESAMFSVCEATYWSRLWIVQEYVLARTAMIHFGLKVADPRPIGFMIVVIATSYSSESVRSRTSDPSWENIGRSIMVHHLRSSYRDHDERENFFQLLARFYDLHCSDPRDMIYGLLALSQSGEHEVPVDYSQEIYQTTAKYIIETIETGGCNIYTR